MAHFNDLSGNRYDMLLVLHRVENSLDGYVQYLCLCDCGNTKVIKGHNLSNGKTHSCGCMKKKMMAEKQFKHGDAGTHHSASSRLYRIWQGMINRCTRQKFRQWKDYGGRGITVCDEWINDYSVFKEWAIQNGYSDDLTIDRINNDGNYEPTNCRWVSMKHQMNNKSNNHLINYNGCTKTLTEWAEELGIPRHTLSERINKRHLPIEKAFEQKVRRNEMQ